MIHTRFITYFASCCFLLCIISGFNCKATFASPDYWPTHGWRSTTPEQQGIDSGKIIEMIERVRNENLAIDSITIIRNGYIVTDAYLYPFEKNTKHFIHSNTKSITSALIGIAHERGYLKNINQPVLEFFPEKTFANLSDFKKAITLENLLTMTSGLDTKDSYLYGWVGLGEMMATDDWAQYVLDLPMVHAPGEYFEYSNGVSYLLSTILQKATGMQAHDFAGKYLFEPLGITDVKWPSNSQGVTIGWGEMMLTPHDMAKLGLLYLSHGRWEDKQIVPGSWVEMSTKKHVAGTLFDGYGYQWWVNSLTSPNYYMAVGYLGQFIFIVPEKNMVVVFTGNNLMRDDFFKPKNLLDEYILPATLSAQSVTAQPKKQQKLNTLLEEITKAPEHGIIWASENVGVAKNGEFSHLASPAFQFKYPKTCTKKARQSDSQVMAMKTLLGSSFSASVNSIPADATLAEVGPRTFVHALQNIGSKFHIVSNKPMTLADGTAAYRTDFDWQWQSSFMLRTMLVSAFKDDKWICLAYTFVASNNTSIPKKEVEGLLIVESLSFR